MRYKTHLVGGALSGIASFDVVTSVINENININMLSPEGAFFMGGAILGSLFPDIDHKGSYIGRRAKVTSFFTSLMLGHRGATHAPIVAGLFTLVLYLLSKAFLASYLVKFAFIGFFIGMLSHILLDMMTKGGVPLLYPFTKKKFSLTKLKTGSKSESFVMFFMVVTLAYLILQNGKMYLVV